MDLRGVLSKEPIQGLNNPGPKDTLAKGKSQFNPIRRTVKTLGPNCGGGISGCSIFFHHLSLTHFPLSFIGKAPCVAPPKMRMLALHGRGGSGSSLMETTLQHWMRHFKEEEEEKI